MLDICRKDAYTYIVTIRKDLEVRGKFALLPCACANLRRATRAVTRAYNRELRPHRLEVTQFTLLMALSLTGEISQGGLGKLLALDSTTLTRMLKLLQKRGWIRAKVGKDQRQRLWRLAPAGREKFLQALPHWKRAQQRLRAGLGEAAWAQLGDLLGEVTEVSINQ